MEERYRALLWQACQQLEPAYVIRESDRVLLAVNSCVERQLGRDPAGEHCYRALMGRESPCPFCPERQAAGEHYTWECYSPADSRLYSVCHLFLEQDGIPCRAARAQDISDVMRLSRTVTDYLSLMKALSDMQARIIGNQDKTLEIVMDSLRALFGARSVAVSYPSPGPGEGLELLSCGPGDACQRRHGVTGAEPELAGLFAADPIQMQVLDTVYDFRLVCPADASAWAENREAVLNIVRLYLENARFREQLEWENHHDKSTQLFNRAHFAALSRGAYAALDRVGVIFLDIDNLKRINDDKGHDMGDRLIKKAADVLLGVSGETVHAYRMGGDEFLVVLCGARQDQVAAMVERLRAGLDTSNELIPMPELSISVGWAWARAPFRLEGLVTRADEMMYEAKRAKKAAREA